MKCMPTWYSKSIYTIDLDILKENKVKYILTDLDNTLAPYNIATPNYETIAFITKLKQQGFIVIIVSNNTGKRVKLFADRLDVEYIAGAKKPFKSTISKYLTKKNIDINDCVLIGDQFMTDIKCANKLNCKSILTSPLSEDESIVTYINRRLDRHYRKKYDLVKKCNCIDRRV